MILQLDPQIPIISPLGKGWAVAIIDYSQDHDLYWVTFDDITGECWTWSNKQIKAQTNITLGRNSYGKALS
jgi:hypothetical protein